MFDRFAKLKAKVAAKLQANGIRRSLSPSSLPGGPPEYDAVYYAGTAWLNSICRGESAERAVAEGNRVYLLALAREESV